MKHVALIISIFFSGSLLGQDCPVTPARDCLDPIESIRSDPGCYCFSCGSSDGKPWMLCTTDSEVASLVEDRAGVGMAVEANELEGEWPRFPTMDPDFERGSDGIPVSDGLTAPNHELLESELKALHEDSARRGGKAAASSDADGEGE